MKEARAYNGNKSVLVMQILLLFFFYIFASGVLTFLGYAVYRSLVNNDAWVHAVIISTVITFAFLILTSVMTMIFTVLIREGWKKASENGGVANESKI
jgi:hypothetical protein